MMVHEWMLARCWAIEDDEKFSALLDQNYILPAKHEDAGMMGQYVCA